MAGFARTHTATSTTDHAPAAAVAGPSRASLGIEPEVHRQRAQSLGHRVDASASAGGPIQCNRIHDKLRGKLYQIRQRKYEQLLSQNSVGQALLTDPHVRYPRLENDPSQAPVYTRNDANQYEGTINLKALPGKSQAESSATYTHEALHKAHDTWAPEVYQERVNSPGTHPAWSNAEEEFTITGRDVVYPQLPNSPLHENAALAEMGLPQRNSHRPAAEDLPHDMSAAEYQQHMAQQQAGVINVGSSSASAAIPPALRARLMRKTAKKK